MKKIVSIMFIIALVVTLSACTDRKYSDDSINVIFFTANRNATIIPSYLNVEPGQKIDEPEEPVRAGFAFNGWYKDFLRTEPFDFDIDVAGEQTMILYAGWIPMTFNIFYELNGGTMPDTPYPETFQTGQRRVLPLPRRTGYTFVAWFTYPWVDESSTIPGDRGLQNVPSAQVEDLHLHAHWRAVTASVTFRSNYPIDGQGPANPNSLVASYGSEINFPVLADTDDYIFIGWNSRRDGEGTWYINGEIFIRTQILTVYGIWQEK